MSTKDGVRNQEVSNIMKSKEATRSRIEDSRLRGTWHRILIFRFLLLSNIIIVFFTTLILFLLSPR